MEDLSYVFLLFLPILLFHLLKLRSSRPSLSSPPSCGRPLPIVGHLHLIKDPLQQALTELGSRHGTIYSLRLGSRSCVVVSSPSAIEECFTKNDVVLANRPRTVAGDRLTYNYSTFAFSPYGHTWRVLRRLSVVEMFSSNRLQNSAALRQEEIRVFVRELAKLCKSEWQKVDLNYLFSAYGFNLIMRQIAGSRCVAEEEICGKLGPENVKRIRGLFFSSVNFGVCDFFPFLRWIGYKGVEKKIISLHEKRDTYLQGLIDEFKGRDNNGFPEKPSRILIETLLSLKESEPEFYTNDIIKSLLGTMIIAGTETSAVTMQSAMSLLLSHPDELNKLRQEIDANIGHNRLINEADLPNLPYLRCIINETLRLHTTVPLLLPHYSSEQCTVGGYTIPKDTTLLVNAWGMHRDPQVWDEPHHFKPERFHCMNLEKEISYKFVPFGVGRRTCPGAGMAMRTISLALGAFVQCFEWKMVSELAQGVHSKSSPGVILPMPNHLEAFCSPRHEAADLLQQLCSS
ncbi:cytochrome P450 81C13-like [Andrographis paniculata]|uniref:cytochrome P450 81C13-like n=1 Tax=Andrographis paniculata TaxID=175694 RepID=UPI0021E88433|nr:cytochrome P450 81C13-like [Andrographis paniculata]